MSEPVVGDPSAVIAYLGPTGTFADSAVRRMPHLAGAEHLPAPSVIAALDMVRSGQVRAAVVPIENSVEGSVSGTLDEISAAPALHITAEVAVPVRFTLMTREPVDLSQIRAVGTHPHAAAQCRRWIFENLPHAEVVATGSTAGAAEELASSNDSFDAAIGNRLAADQFGLVPLIDDIADNREAVTRFVQVEQPGRLPAPTGADKTSLLLYMKSNRSGALLEILTEIAVRGINLSRLESRPTRQALGEYCFSVDLEGHVAEARVGEALMGLRRTCSDVVFLGSYPRLDGREPELPAGVSDDGYREAGEWLAALRGAHPRPQT